MIVFIFVIKKITGNGKRQMCDFFLSSVVVECNVHNVPHVTAALYICEYIL